MTFLSRSAGTASLRALSMRAMQKLLAVLVAGVVGCASPPPARVRSAPPMSLPQVASPVAAAIVPGPMPRRGVKPMDGEIGTAHPILVDRAARDGHWLVICQAREDTNHDGAIRAAFGMHGDVYGDRMRPYLVTAPGAGEPIDAFVAADPRGRFVAVIESEKVVLVDTYTGRRLELPDADPRDDPSPFGPHRAASFDASGRHLLTIAKGEAAAVEVRDLQTGATTRIAAGSGRLWRARIDGAYVVLRVVDAHWPAPITWLARRGCRGTVASYGVMGMTGDQPQTRVAPIDGGPARDVPDLIRPLGDALLRRQESGALVLERRDGTLVEIASARCNGVLREADPASGRVLVACRSGDGDRGRLEIDGVGFHRELGIAVDTMGDEWSRRPRRQVIEAGGTTVVDLRAGRARQFPMDFDHEGGRLLATFGSRVLVQRGTQLSVGALDVATELPLAAPVPQYPVYFQSGSFAWAEPWVVNLASARVVGRIDEPVLAIAPSGYVLAPRAPATKPLVRISGVVPHGPLVWRWPVAPP